MKKRSAVVVVQTVAIVDADWKMKKLAQCYLLNLGVKHGHSEVMDVQSEP